MQTFVTGYQYGNRNQFVGQYVFETHADFEPHIPPNTVLVDPPKNIPEGQEAIWMGEQWILQTVPEIPKPPKLKDSLLVPTPTIIIEEPNL
jgi:hypothetical protein